MKNIKLNYVRNTAKMGFAHMVINADSLMVKINLFIRNYVTIIRKNNVKHFLNVDIAHMVRDVHLNIMNFHFIIQGLFLVRLQKYFCSMKMRVQ